MKLNILTEMTGPLYLGDDFYLLLVTGTKFTDVVHDDHPSFLYCLMGWE